jgi:hypothetical protein
VHGWHADHRRLGARPGRAGDRRPSVARPAGRARSRPPLLISSSRYSSAAQAPSHSARRIGRLAKLHSLVHWILVARNPPAPETQEILSAHTARLRGTLPFTTMEQHGWELDIAQADVLRLSWLTIAGRPLIEVLAVDLRDLTFMDVRRSGAVGAAGGTPVPALGHRFHCLESARLRAQEGACGARVGDDGVEGLDLRVRIPRPHLLRSKAGLGHVKEGVDGR